MIPTKEQFIELNTALNQNIEFIESHIDYTGTPSAIHTVLSHPNRQILSEVLAEGDLQEFIKPDVELYLEQSQASQKLPAWKWLHSQQNFAKAKDRLFKHWPSEEQPANGLERFIARYAVTFFLRRMDERQRLVSTGEEYAPKTHEAWMVNRDPLEIFQSALRFAGRRAVCYRKWIAGVMVALADYHYGNTAEIALNRRNRVGALIAAWENLNEQIALARTDPELGEYLQRTVLNLADNARLNALRALHQKGTLYFIGRADETVSERLFIRELALLHRELFYRPHTSAILDMFYLEGMKSAPTERAIQRVAKSAVANWKEIGRVESEVRELRRHKSEGNSSTTV